jgi:hypothetical protein
VTKKAGPDYTDPREAPIRTRASTTDAVLQRKIALWQKRQAGRRHEKSEFLDRWVKGGYS